MRRRIGIVAGVALLLACTELKRAEEPPPASPIETDGGAEDAPADGGAPSDASSEDAGTPPDDFECSGDTWVKPTKTRAVCAPRQVKVVDDGRPTIGDISIARTPAGRIGIAFHAAEFVDQGDMRLVHFIPTKPTFVPTKIDRSNGPFSQAGYNVRLGASGPDTLHVLAHDVDDTTIGDVVHFELVSGKEPFTSPNAVFTSVSRVTELAFAVDTAGNAFATARIRTGTTDAGAPIASLVARRMQSGGDFVALPEIATDLRPEDAPGTGAAFLDVDGDGKVNLLFHHCNDQYKSRPYFQVFDGALWSARKTISAGVPDGITGFNPRLAVRGARKYAAYFYRRGNQSGAATADLRVATWSLANETIVPEVVDQGLFSSDVMAPRYRVAMAVDVYGLVHLAIVRPTNQQTAYLEYRRQTRDAGGRTKWLSDLVDDDVSSATGHAVVDIVVDAAARPHIAYYSGVDGKIRYATRYDR